MHVTAVDIVSHGVRTSALAFMLRMNRDIAFDGKRQLRRKTILQTQLSSGCLALTPSCSPSRFYPTPRGWVLAGNGEPFASKSVAFPQVTGGLVVVICICDIFAVCGLTKFVVTPFVIVTIPYPADCCGSEELSLFTKRGPAGLMSIPLPDDSFDLQL